MLGLRSQARIAGGWMVVAGLSLFTCGDCAHGDETSRAKAQAMVDEVTVEIDRATEPDAGLYETRADAYMTLGAFDKAYEDYSKAMSITPGTTFFLSQKRIFAAIGIGDYRQALADAQGGTRVRISPPHSEPFSVLALVLARSPDDKVKDAEAALGAALLAANMDVPKKNEALIETALAAAHSVNGDFKAAVLHQEKAIAAIKGKVPADMKAALEAYKAGKDYPFQKTIP